MPVLLRFGHCRLRGGRQRRDGAYLNVACPKRAGRLAADVRRIVREDSARPGVVELELEPYAELDPVNRGSRLAGTIRLVPSRQAILRFLDEGGGDETDSNVVSSIPSIRPPRAAENALSSGSDGGDKHLMTITTIHRGVQLRGIAFSARGSISSSASWRIIRRSAPMSPSFGSLLQHWHSKRVCKNDALLSSRPPPVFGTF